MLHCNRCQGSGFLNLHQIDNFEDDWDLDKLLKWINDNTEHDVQVCDCCGDGEGWYGEAGSHYSDEDLAGKDGVYGYNGGHCECH